MTMVETTRLVYARACVREHAGVDVYVRMCVRVHVRAVRARIYVGNVAAQDFQGCATTTLLALPSPPPCLPRTGGSERDKRDGLTLLLLPRLPLLVGVGSTPLS